MIITGRRWVRFAIAMVAAALVCGPVWSQDDDEGDDLAADPSEAQAPTPAQFPWPSHFSAGNQSFTIYPPELDRWDQDRLQGRAAVAVLSGGESKPVYGVADITATVQVDEASHLATAREITITRVDFPTVPQQAPRYQEALQAHLATMSWQLPAEELRGQLAVEKAARISQSQPVRNDPPNVLFSDRPAILVPIDGPPVLKDLVGMGLKRVLNTRALILQDPESDRYFLNVGGRWMESRTLEGPWADAQIRPSALDDAKRQALESGQVDLLESDMRTAASPRIIVTTTPSELVQTDGPPQYSPVPGTQLLYVTNTPNRLFLDLNTQQYYVLLSGRWFRTRALDQARWEYVAGSALPRDFAAIPDPHPSATVREAVPGTPQAREAAIANSVPQVATVKRTEAHLDITYDGPPQFKPIEGTPLDYVINAPIPVIRVDDRNYYALDDGVWFFSATLDGPWTAASYVPAVIYTIPRSSPLHYVTYVRVYGATSDSVSVGYSPGYVGSYVNTESTVVYGSGYWYRPWVGSMWYGYPTTWGFGFTYWNSWWNPWPWRPWWVYRPVPYYRPWWGPWHRPYYAHRPPPPPPPAAVRPVPVPPSGVARPLPVPRPTVSKQTNVTNIYQRWGRNVARPNPVPVPTLSRTVAPVPTPPGARPPVSVQGQRLRSDVQETMPRSVPAPQAVQPAAPAGTPQVITVPRQSTDVRSAPNTLGTIPQTSMPSPATVPPSSTIPPAQPSTHGRSIVGPTPGVQPPAQPRALPNTPRSIVGPTPGIPTQPHPGATPMPVPVPTPGAQTQPRTAPQPTVIPVPAPQVQPHAGVQPNTPHPIVGPAPGVQPPQAGGVQPGVPRSVVVPSTGGRGRASTAVPGEAVTPTAPVRQRFEMRGALPRPVPVPAPAMPRAYGNPRVQSGPIGIPSPNGRVSGAGARRGAGRGQPGAPHHGGEGGRR